MHKQRQDKRVILLGYPNAGKTSMIRLIFQNYSIADVTEVAVGPTTEVEKNRVEIIEGTCCTVIDTCGQDAISQHWFKTNVLKQDVDVLIFVIACDSEDWINNLSYFVESLKRLYEVRYGNPNYSSSQARNKSGGKEKEAEKVKKIKIIIIIHKIDLLPGYAERKTSYNFANTPNLPDHRQDQQEDANSPHPDLFSKSKYEKLQTFKNKIDSILNKDEEFKKVLNNSSLPIKSIIDNITYKMSTIFDESLHRVWADVISSLVPNIQKYEDKVKEFCLNLNADEVTIFQNHSFLSLASFRRYEHQDEDDNERNDKASNFYRKNNEKIMALIKQYHWDSDRRGGYGYMEPQRRRGKTLTINQKSYQLRYQQIPGVKFLSVLVVFYMTEKRKIEKYGNYYDSKPTFISLPNLINSLKLSPKKDKDMFQSMISSTKSTKSFEQYQTLNAKVNRSSFHPDFEKSEVLEYKNEPRMCEYPEVVEAAIREFGDELRGIREHD